MSKWFFMSSVHRCSSPARFPVINIDARGEISRNTVEIPQDATLVYWGGAFNPPTSVHERAVQWLQQHFGPHTYVLMSPCYQDARISDAKRYQFDYADRSAMCALVTAHLPNVFATDLDRVSAEHYNNPDHQADLLSPELEFEGGTRGRVLLAPTSTAAVLTYVQSVLHFSGRIVAAYGDDLFPGVRKWSPGSMETVATLCDQVLIFGRTTDPSKSPPEAQHRLAEEKEQVFAEWKARFPHKFVECAVDDSEHSHGDISSTLVRKALNELQPPHEIVSNTGVRMLSDEVATYLHNKIRDTRPF